MAGDNEKQTAKKRVKPDSEQMRLKKEEQARRSRRRRRQFIGLAISVLVVVGAFSIIFSGINVVKSMADNSEEFAEYEDRFKGFVWFDVLPFDSVSKVDENTIKQVIIWSILDDQMESLERNEYGEALIPASEVELYAARIFGPDFRFSGHSSFTDPAQQLSYLFDEETQRYTAPSTSLNYNYLPTVVDIVRESGGVRRVVMGYVSAISSDNKVVATPDFEHPVRYMDFMLRRDGNSYYLFAIQPNTTHTVTKPTDSSSVVQSASISESLPPQEQSTAESQSASEISQAG